MAAKNEPAPRASAVALSDTIIVRVGVEIKKYTIHKRLLIHHSDYFRGALSGGFRETHDCLIPLDDVKSAVFDIFVDWIYEKRLPDCINDMPAIGSLASIRYHAYVLADRLIAPAFKTAVFDSFFEFFNRSKGYPAYTSLTFAFNSLPENDPLLQLLVDVFCAKDGIQKYAVNKDLSKELTKVPLEAFDRLFLRMHAIKGLSKEEMVLKRDASKI